MALTYKTPELLPPLPGTYSPDKWKDTLIIEHSSKNTFDHPLFSCTVYSKTRTFSCRRKLIQGENSILVVSHPSVSV